MLRVNPLPFTGVGLFLLFASCPQTGLRDASEPRRKGIIRPETAP